MLETGCIHYRRKAKLVAPCCQKVYTCRMCHDDSEDHPLVRGDVVELECALCNCRQPVSSSCSSCHVVFGQYFCEICCLFDDEPKQQFHCNDCGICRSGGRDNFFHCKVCDHCFPIKLNGNHKCVELEGRNDCAICLEDLHTSRSGVAQIRCGHMLHVPCLQGLIKHEIFTCPKCTASMFNMAKRWMVMDREVKRCKVPREFRNTYVGVVCKDCQAHSETKYHEVGLKCLGCGSYNTARDPGPLIRRQQTGGWQDFVNSFREMISSWPKMPALVSA